MSWWIITVMTKGQHGVLKKWRTTIDQKRQEEQDGDQMYQAD